MDAPSKKSGKRMSHDDDDGEWDNSDNENVQQAPVAAAPARKKRKVAEAKPEHDAPVAVAAPVLEIQQLDDAFKVLPSDCYRVIVEYKEADKIVPDVFGPFLQLYNNHRYSTQYWRVMCVKGVFGTFFSLLQPALRDILPTDVMRDTNRLANNPRSQKERESAATKLTAEANILHSCLVNPKQNPVRWILPRFGCQELLKDWSLSPHPLDIFNVYPSIALHSDASDILSATPSKDATIGNEAHHIHPDMALINALYRIDFSDIVRISIRVNMSLFSRLLQHWKDDISKIPCSAFLIRHLGASVLNLYHPKNNDDYTGVIRPKTFVPALNEATQCQLEEAFSSLKMTLFPYQKQAVSWMSDLEKWQDEISYSFTVGFACGDTPVAYDAVGDAFFFKNGPIDDRFQPTLLKARGGLLADEMGLGKTVQTMALVAARPMRDPVIIERLATNNMEPSCLIRSRATLVIAPNQLATTVWRTTYSQVMRNDDNALGVIVICTKYDFNRYTVRQLMLADLVIVSVEFFEGNEHLHAIDATMDVGTARHSVASRTREYIGNMMRCLHDVSDERVMKLRRLPMFMFRWHRLVVDESQELLSDKYSLHQLLSKDVLRFNHVWCLSGTPFPTALNHNRTWQLLRSPACDIIISEKLDRMCNATRLDLESKFMWRTIMWRTTKKSVEAEIGIPPMIEHVHVLEFTNTERFLYEQARQSRFLDAMRRLCCQVNVPGANNANDAVVVQHRSIDEIEALLLGEHRGLLTQYDEELNEVEHKKARNEGKLQGHLISPHNSPTQQAAKVEKLLDKISKLDERVALLKTFKETAMRKTAYFEAALAIRGAIRFDEARKTNILADHACAVCMEDAIADPAITCCGHIFCVECIETCRKTQHKCPVCRTMLDAPNSVMPITIGKPAEQVANAANVTALGELVNRYGTKMGNLVHHMHRAFQASPNDKIIVFASQMEDIRRLKTVFDEQTITSVTCYGNVAVRTNAILKFNDRASSVRVMLLCLSNNAAGTNLTVADEIILFDSLWDEDEGRHLATELQAMNRAHRVGQDKQVRIVRLLIRNTVEMDRYKALNANFDDSVSHTTRELVIG